jgi:citrate/tricarballylate utilization protein
MAFVLLLFLVSASGLLLYAVTGMGAVGAVLTIHLGTVLAFFVLAPYSKMAHGFYRMAALTKEATNARELRQKMETA